MPEMVNMTKHGRHTLAVASGVHRRGREAVSGGMEAAAVAELAANQHGDGVSHEVCVDDGRARETAGGI